MRFGTLMAALLSCAAPLAAQSTAPADSVRALFRADRGDDALVWATRLAERRPADASAQHALAVAGLRSGDMKLATAAADSAVALAPDVAAYQLTLADAYYAKAQRQSVFGALGSAKKGKRANERAVALDPDYLAAREMLMGFHLEAPGIAGGDRDEARRQAAEIGRRDPLRGLTARLYLASRTKRKDELAALVDTALPLVGSPADTARWISGALIGAIERVDDDDLKERLIAKAYAAHPADPQVRYQRAKLWTIQERNLAEAERLFLDYLKQAEIPRGAPTHGGAWWRLGQIYEEQERRAEALAAYRKAAELMPEFEEARKDANRLEKEG